MAEFKLYRQPDFVEWWSGLPSLVRSEIGVRLDRLPVLNGGDKTTQRADIRRAKALAKAWN